MYSTSISFIERIFISDSKYQIERLVDLDRCSTTNFIKLLGKFGDKAIFPIITQKTQKSDFIVV